MSNPSGWNAEMSAGTKPWTGFRRTVVAVSATEAALPSTQLANRKGLRIYNSSAVPVFVGPTGVAATDEVEILPRGSEYIPASDQVTLYARTASASDNIVVWEYV